jgi:hypothetical protein
MGFGFAARAVNKLEQIFAYTSIVEGRSPSTSQLLMRDLRAAVYLLPVRLRQWCLLAHGVR